MTGFSSFFKLLYLLLQLVHLFKCNKKKQIEIKRNKCTNKRRNWSILQANVLLIRLQVLWVWMLKYIQKRICSYQGQTKALKSLLSVFWHWDNSNLHNFMCRITQNIVCLRNTTYLKDNIAFRKTDMKLKFKNFSFHRKYSKLLNSFAFIINKE